MLDWRKRQQARASVRVTVLDELDRLPTAYTDEMYQTKSERDVPDQERFGLSAYLRKLSRSGQEHLCRGELDRTELPTYAWGRGMRLSTRCDLINGHSERPGNSL